MKKIFKLFIALVLVAGVALFAAAPYIGSRIQNEVETKGSEMAKAEIKLGDIGVSLLGGSVSMSNVFVGNPEGFKADSAFKLGNASATVDLNTVLEDVLVIKEIIISQPEITYEVGVRGSNVSTIQKNIEKAIGSSKTTSQGSETAGEESSQKVIIETLVIEEAKVRLGAYVAGEGDDFDVTIPRIQMNNIGKEEGGIDKAEATKEVLAAVNKELIKHGGAQGVMEKVKGWFN